MSVTPAVTTPRVPSPRLGPGTQAGQGSPSVLVGQSISVLGVGTAGRGFVFPADYLCNHDNLSTCASVISGASRSVDAVTVGAVYVQLLKSGFTVGSFLTTVVMRNE